MKYNYKASKNYRPAPIQDSTFYFLKGYLIRISNEGRSIWLYDRVSYISNLTGKKSLECGIEEVYKTIERYNKKIEQQARDTDIEFNIKQQLKPLLSVIIKELKKSYKQGKDKINESKHSKI